MEIAVLGFWNFTLFSHLIVPLGGTCPFGGTPPLGGIPTVWAIWPFGGIPLFGGMPPFGGMAPFVALFGTDFCCGDARGIFLTICGACGCFCRPLTSKRGYCVHIYNWRLSIRIIQNLWNSIRKLTWVWFSQSLCWQYELQYLAILHPEHVSLALRPHVQQDCN